MGNEILQQAAAGAGIMDNISVTEIATDANQTLTVAQMSGGAILYTGFSAGRNLTTPTAALILAAATDMDIGDSFSFIVSIQDAFAGTWVAGTDVTLAGRATTPASSWSMVVVTKTSATTVRWTVL
jgi:hypothetical protein